MTIINDPQLEPYYIGKDSHCYTAYEKITPDPKYTQNGNGGEEYTKPIGHFSSFGSALRAIMKAKFTDGLLTVEVPFAEEAKPKVLKIN